MSYVSEVSAEGKAEITQTLELLAAKHLGASFDPDRQPFPPPPEAKAATPTESSPESKASSGSGVGSSQGKIEIGDVLYGGVPRFPLKIDVDTFNTHALVCGRSGSGKSVLTMHLARKFMNRDIIVTVFDWKRSYRQLVRQVPEGSLRVLTPGREHVAPMRWNPLIPPQGCEPMLYAKLIVDVICRALLGGEGVISLMHRGLETLYRECGLLDGQVERYPTINDLLDWIERTKLTGRAGMWKASADRILRAMTYGDFGRMIDTQSSADLLAILESNSVIELDGLAGSADRQLFAEGVTLWLSRCLLARGERPSLERLWVHEEASHLLSQSEIGAQETTLEQALRLIRAYGAGICVVDQQCSSLSKTVFANTGTTFCLNQKLRSDVQAITGALNLTPEQRDAVSTLPVGQAIVRLPEGHPEPFLIQVPPPPSSAPGMADDVSDDELAKRHASHCTHATSEDLIVQEYLSLNVEERSRTSPSDSVMESPEQASSVAITPLPGSDNKNHPRQPDGQPPAGTPHQYTSELKTPDQRKHRSDPSVYRPKTEAVSLLDDIINHPLATTVERYDRLKLSRRRGHALRSDLVQQGYLKPERIPTRSGNVVLLGLTQAGRTHALELGLSPPAAPREGLSHRYWVGRVATALKNDGYAVKTEYHVEGNGHVDLWATREDTSVQVEIETGQSDIAMNLTKCIGHADRVLLVATCPAATRRCAAAVIKLSKHEQSRVEVRTWLDYS